MDQQALRELLEFLSSSDIQELKLEGDDFRLEVRRNMPAPQAVMLPAPASPMVAEVAAAAPAAAASPPPAAAASRGDLVEVKAPMVGTFYRRPAPDQDAYVDVGVRVGSDSTVCIVEAMKVNNDDCKCLGCERRTEPCRLHVPKTVNVNGNWLKACTRNSKPSRSKGLGRHNDLVFAISGKCLQYQGECIKAIGHGNCSLTADRVGECVFELGNDTTADVCTRLKNLNYVAGDHGG